jgi:glycosyltransferase involved in cell wall biosynthesis
MSENTNSNNQRPISNGMRVLQISSDRSARGILHPGSPAFMRQEAYASRFGELDIIAFTQRIDKVHTIDAGPLHIYPTNALSRLLHMFYAVHIARTIQKPTVISVQDPFETGLVGWWIARRQRIPLHVQVHTDFLSPAYRRHSLLNRVRVHIAKFVLKRATRIRVVSQSIKNSIISKYHVSTPITVLPIFVDIESFKNAKVDAVLEKKFTLFKTKVLVVARLEPEKNVALAIRSFGSATPHDACLIVVGEGRQKSMLETLAGELSISERVFFEGSADAQAYYPIADLVVVPSLYEGYGLVAVEALASGIPVISTATGIAREAGAITTTTERFADALAKWFLEGPKEMALVDYPYQTFEQYTQLYCEDVLMCASDK